MCASRSIWSCYSAQRRCHEPPKKAPAYRAPSYIVPVAQVHPLYSESRCQSPVPEELEVKMEPYACS